MAVWVTRESRGINAVQGEGGEGGGGGMRSGSAAVPQKGIYVKSPAAVHDSIAGFALYP